MEPKVSSTPSSRPSVSLSQWVRLVPCASSSASVTPSPSVSGDVGSDISWNSLRSLSPSPSVSGDMRLEDTLNLMVPEALTTVTVHSLASSVSLKPSPSVSVNTTYDEAGTNTTFCHIFWTR